MNKTAQTMKIMAEASVARLPTDPRSKAKAVTQTMAISKARLLYSLSGV
jgi:hypothetical protein